MLHNSLRKLIYDFRGISPSAALIKKTFQEPGKLLCEIPPLGTIELDLDKQTLCFEGYFEHISNRICFINRFTFLPDNSCPATLEKRFITVHDVVDFVLDFENQTRFNPINFWYGEPDIHHTWFEGLVEVRDCVYEVFWGS